MVDITRIIKAIDKFLEIKHQDTTTPVEINPYLEKEGILNDSALRPGKPIREILRKGKIPHAYQIGVHWSIPHSGNNSKNIKPTNNPKANIKIKPNNTDAYSGHKLKPLGDLIVGLIEKEHNMKASCVYEYKPEWLLSNPTNQLLEKYSELNELYKELTDNQFLLKEKILELSDKKLNQKQSYDIWIGEPFNFAIEFDEKQHFNQYRRITLDYYDKIETKFPVKFYKKLNEDVEIKPGKSGFTRLKSYDPLFPEMLEAEKQDNRIRQRAFRDFLKDLLPIENGFNPTLRIPYHVTDMSITDFSEAELKNIEKYIKDYDLI